MAVWYLQNHRSWVLQKLKPKLWLAKLGIVIQKNPQVPPPCHNLNNFGQIIKNLILISPKRLEVVIEKKCFLMETTIPLYPVLTYKSVCLPLHHILHCLSYITHPPHRLQALPHLFLKRHCQMAWRKATRPIHYPTHKSAIVNLYIIQLMAGLSPAYLLIRGRVYLRLHLTTQYIKHLNLDNNEA